MGCLVGPIAVICHLVGLLSVAEYHLIVPVRWDEGQTREQAAVLKRQRDDAKLFGHPSGEAGGVHKTGLVPREWPWSHCSLIEDVGRLARDSSRRARLGLLEWHLPRLTPSLRPRQGEVPLVPLLVLLVPLLLVLVVVLPPLPPLRSEQALGDNRL